MSYLLFLDESGHDHKHLAYEVRGGIAVHASRLWPFIQAIGNLEADCFGSTLGEFGVEIKGHRLADKDRWRWASQGATMSDSTRRIHASGFLNAAREGRAPRRHEFTAYGQACIAMGHGIFQLLDEHHVVILASFIPRTTIPPTTLKTATYLRKDHVFMLERYYWLLEERNEAGLIVMDRCEHSLDGRFVRQMQRYFTQTENGRVRAARIIPYPFFVDSHLVSPVQIADFCIYCLNTGFRLPSRGMNAPARQEIVDRIPTLQGRAKEEEARTHEESEPPTSMFPPCPTVVNDAKEHTVSDVDETALQRRIDLAHASAALRAKQVVDEVTEAFAEVMTRRGITRRKLAQTMGVSPARVTRLLQGDQPFSVETLVMVADALECDLSFRLTPRDHPGDGVGTDSPASQRFVAAETRLPYETRYRTRADRDKEIRAHLACGKLRVVGDNVLMRHEADGVYRPARFRRAGEHSVKVKTNVGQRAYYRDRIIAIAREMEP
jgi:transcriptional regulator with XRE-family HTH domain